MDPVRRALGTMAKPGWGKFENNNASVEADFKSQREEMLAEAAMIAAPFLTPEGQDVLQLLVEKTFMRPLIQPVEVMTLEQHALYAARREGQNQVVAMLLNAVAAVSSQGTPSVPLATGDV
jgi:hypothetical protein